MTKITEAEVAAAAAKIPAARRREIELWARETGKVIREVVDPLRQRIAELEQRSTMSYRGTWDPQVTYRRGDVVTHAGAAWHAAGETHADKPGIGASWRLMVKAGRDGRDAQGKTPVVA